MTNKKTFLTISAIVAVVTIGFGIGSFSFFPASADHATNDTLAGHLNATEDALQGGDMERAMVHTELAVKEGNITNITSSGQ